jgi:hypothetical protein
MLANPDFVGKGHSKFQAVGSEIQKKSPLHTPRAKSKAHIGATESA